MGCSSPTNIENSSVGLFLNTTFTFGVRCLHSEAIGRTLVRLGSKRIAVSVALLEPILVSDKVTTLAKLDAPLNKC